MRLGPSRILGCGAAIGVGMGAITATAQAQSSNDRRQGTDREAPAPAFVSIETINDAAVTNAAGTEIAEVEDLIVDTRTGHTVYAIIETHERDGVEEKVCLAPYGALAWDPQTGSFRISSEAGLLNDLPRYEEGELAQLREESWLSTLRGLFGEREEIERIADSRHHDEYTAAFQSQEPVILRGQVVAINRQAVSAMGVPYYAVMIDTEEPEASKRQAMVLVAPTGYLESKQLAPKESDTASFHAVKAIDENGRTVYIAKAASIRGKETIHLRDDDGAPSWQDDESNFVVSSSHGYRLASELAGGTVYSSDGESFGTIDDVVFEAHSGTAAYAKTSVGGVLGIDDTDYAIPCGSFSITSHDNVYSHLPAQKLKLAPKLSEDGIRDLNAREFREQVRSFFGVDRKEYDTMRSAKWTRDGAERRE